MILTLYLQTSHVFFYVFIYDLRAELSSLCAVVLPDGAELSSVGVTVVKLLQHLLTLGVGERVTEGEEGGGSSHLGQTVSERQDELVIYDLEKEAEKRRG